MAGVKRILKRPMVWAVVCMTVFSLVLVNFWPRLNRPTEAAVQQTLSVSSTAEFEKGTLANSYAYSDQIQLEPNAKYAWYNSSWDYRQKITIDHTKVSNTDQSDFPVLIKITDESNGIFSHAQDDGDDILFTSDDEKTKLSHEIETFSKADHALWAWVKIPTLSYQYDTTLYMYYGNPSCSSQQDATGVWDSNYAGVWHLGDAGPTTAADSTSNANNGTQSGGVTFGATGQINSATSYDGTDDYVGNLGNFGHPNTLTISSWFKTTDASWDILFGQTNVIPPSAANTFISVFAIKATGVLRAELWTGSEGEISTTSSVRDGNWHQAVMVGNVNTQSLYVDGQLIGSRSGTISQSWWVYSFIGTGYDCTSRGFPSTTWHYFNGTLDEVRISNTARSASWIATEYNNQNSPESFYAVGEEEAY